MLVGHVEHYSEEGISGWAFNDERPTEPEFVDILIDGELFARIRADLPRRSDDGTACGFKLLLPPEFRLGRRRAFVDVRFARTWAPLGNSPRYVAFNGTAKRVLVMIPAGPRYNHDEIKAYPVPLRDHIEKYTNTGDWMVYDSSLKLLAFAELQPINVWTATDDDVARFNANYNYAFLRGSNYINETINWRTMDTVLAKLKIPVIAFGIGAQAPHRRKLQLSEASIRMWRMFADHAASIGVRGDYSAEVLNDIGIKNVDVIGCPSLFRHNNPYLWLRPKPIEEVRRVAFNLRREVSPDYANDIACYLSVQKTAIKTLVQDYDLTVTTHGEPAEKAFFYKDKELIGKYRAELLASGWFESDADAMASIYENRLFYSQTVADYDRFIRSQDLALGFRVHGNLPALANGVPALAVDYDARSQELAETFRIPMLTLDDLARHSLAELYKPELWDDFNRHYAHAYARMAAFLDKNGIAHNMTRLSG